MSIFTTGIFGLSAQATKIITGVLGMAGIAIGLLMIVDAIGDGRENKLRLDAAETVLENIGMADAVDRRLEDRDDDAEDRLEEVIDDAVKEDPDGAAAPAGSVTNAAVDELRRSRTAGEREPPSD